MIFHHVIKIAQNFIYKHMKLNEVSADHYSYHSFFNDITEKLDIIVMEHDLNNEIAGLSIKDAQGNFSISYQKTHHKYRQNFTKCHELGHFLLEHKGSVFTYSKDNTPQELEANIFASILLAPDIVLLGKIVYYKKTFQELLSELEMSRDALHIRLKQFLNYHTTLHDDEIILIIQSYLTRKAPDDIIYAIKQAEKSIIEEYQAVTIQPIDFIDRFLKQNNIVTSVDVKELADKHFIENIKQVFPNIVSDFYFDYGKTLYYIYQPDKTTATQARQSAKNAHFNMVFLNLKIE